MKIPEFDEIKAHNVRNRDGKLWVMFYCKPKIQVRINGGSNFGLTLDEIKRFPEQLGVYICSLGKAARRNLFAKLPELEQFMDPFKRVRTQQQVKVEVGPEVQFVGSKKPAEACQSAGADKLLDEVVAKIRIIKQTLVDKQG